MQNTTAQVSSMTNGPFVILNILTFVEVKDVNILSSWAFIQTVSELKFELLKNGIFVLQIQLKGSPFHLQASKVLAHLFIMSLHWTAR